jgi:hypothetical protein
LKKPFTFVTNNHSISHGDDKVCYMPIRWCGSICQHHDSCHWFDELISSINLLKILLSFAINNDLVFHVTCHDGNKVSQIFMAIYIFCDTISFCVSWIYGTNICHGMPNFFYMSWGFWSHEFICMCMLY